MHAKRPPLSRDRSDRPPVRAPAPVSGDGCSRGSRPAPRGLPGREGERNRKAEGQAEDSREAESAQQS